MAGEEMSGSMFARYEPRGEGKQREGLPAGIVIAEGAAEDAEGVARILAEREGIGLGEAHARAQKWEQEAAEKRLLLVARLNGAVTGYGRVKWVERPAEAGYEQVPAGWYLMGVIVGREFRRRGIGEELTRRRLAWIGERAREAFYFANSRNRASIDLHRRLGFEEVVRGFRFPGAHLSGGGEGVLFRASLG
jgi:ribosomal protein S18 acetylase RimI-like enzyme